MDTQNHFFLSDSPFCVNNHLSVLNNVQKVLKWARNRHVLMVSTVHVNNSSAAHVGSFLAGGFSIDKPTCTLCRSRILLKAMDCTDLPSGLVEQYQQVILHKRAFDPFSEPRFDRLLTELNANNFVVIGAPTEGAVKATTLGLLARGERVAVVTDAIGSLNSRLAKKALRQMKAKGARLVNTAALLNLTRMARPAPCN